MQRMKGTLTRRQLLMGAAWGGVAAGLGGRAAQAFSIEPMPAPVSKAYGLACQPASSGATDHVQLIADVQAMLKGEIASGLKPANAQEVVVCPLCGCAITVTADASN
ncbi:MAG TPA: twin-arginine translocation signal domain-containing protein [Hypericibacter adhaerens]|jgi:hypothetical protein|uniref:Uncharacterized protein n=1 Tax=Hypericibacter adhaerens TaxID=2602016 RepID=A0A5J6N6Y0_9PROT|nr:twin-arginine translocation signal domain-containing protein [Hypericibacter adhaerens]QEX24460.1 hypothetical protein FRZ61_44010 [Hypericibacter adhaerens]HWA45736.1 twin-arginine translocation signal domain-containing protein [Hypericibacter adhaerens]